MKTKLTLIWIGIITLNFSCKNDMTTSEKNRINTEEWIPAYTKLPQPVNVDDRTMYCFRVENSRSNLEKSVQEEIILSIYDKENVFPEYFGGQYRSEEKTYVLLTDTSEQVKKEYMELCQVTPDDVIFKPCTYSFNELLRLWHKLEAMPTVKNNKDIFPIFIRQATNCVLVVFDGEKDESKIQWFKSEIIDSPMIKFNFLQDIRKESANKAGTPKMCANKLQNDYVTTGQNFLTEDLREGRIGFKGYLRYSGSETHQHGFITAAHVFRFENLDYSLYQAHSFDLPEENRFATSVYLNPRYDVAFCKLDPGITLYTNHNPKIVEIRGDELSNIIVHIEDKQLSASTYGGEHPTIRIDNCPVQGVALCYLQTETSLQRGDSGTLVTDTENNIVGIALAIEPNSKCFYIAQAYKFWGALDLKLKP
ncbi:trypsin-like peptidase domain-containing protein [Butyricimonas hominis]|uniref:Trypsin-like peptidase domain-containing protein n=1 Tax=Butyricimonas hominis TaxID=2763032 RepID=A0ABR7CVW2_9BACT|nr:trypsin-like peptidase domain-containing protein [Butyricimonas hominis]MBC5619817.1 trypsin-like peptidase domain-containing protein [Butyricimonas hominis]